MAKKYRNHRLTYAGLWHNEEKALEPRKMQLKKSNQLSLPQRDDFKTGKDTKNYITKSGLRS